jgi:hypothetical protein
MPDICAGSCTAVEYDHKIWSYLKKSGTFFKQTVTFKTEHHISEPNQLQQNFDLKTVNGMVISWEQEL